MLTTQVYRPVLAVDVVVMTVWRGALHVLLPIRIEEPFLGALSLPGVAIGVDEILLQGARRALLSKGGFSTATVERVYLEQLAAFDALYRDPRGRTVSMAFLGLIRSSEADEITQHAWQACSSLVGGSLPFDHEEIIKTSVERLRGKLRYTNIASHLLPGSFRIEELQEVYEAVLVRSLNRTNFRMKLLKIGLIEKTGILGEAVGRQGGRPPHLYRFIGEDLKKIDRDFL